MLAKREQSRTVMDTFGGYMELEVNGAFPVSQTAFLKGLDRISRNRMKLDTVLGLPLFLSELSVVIALGLLVASGDGDVKMVVGVFAITAFRLLPALRTLLTGWTQIQNAAYSLNTIEEGLAGPAEAVSTYSEEIPFEKEITIRRLAYTYPDSGRCWIISTAVSVRGSMSASGGPAVRESPHCSTCLQVCSNPIRERYGLTGYS